LFVIKGLLEYPNNEIIIFNRWGNVVYQKQGYLNDWTGENTNNFSTGNGQLPEGTYFYIINLNDENGSKFQGYVYLKR
jgi:gliding motility-associated-like protein